MTDIQDLNPGQLRQLQKAQELQAFGEEVLPSGPWATQVKWAQRAGLIGIRLINKTRANVVLTERGKAILEQHKETAR